MDVDKRIVPGLDGLADKCQACLLWHSAAFFDVAVGARADHIFPYGFSAHSSGDDVVQRQLAGRIALAAILTPILVASKDIATIELHVGRRQAVIEQQPDNSRYGYIKINRGYPVVSVRLKTASELAHFAPALKVIVGILALL